MNRKQKKHDLLVMFHTYLFMAQERRKGQGKKDIITRAKQFARHQKYVPA